MGLNIQFASAWLKAFTAAPDSVLSFYADDFEFSNPPQELYFRADPKGFQDAMRPLANRDPANGLGVHRLEALEYLGDYRSGLVIWRWTIRHADRVFGIDTHRRLVRTTGASFHVYMDGKIAREIVYSDQIHVAQELGLPVHLRGLRIDPFAPPGMPRPQGLRH